MQSRQLGTICLQQVLAHSNRICSTHVGKNPLGNTFGMAFQDYEATVMRPFQQFLRGVYCKCLRVHI